MKSEVKGISMRASGVVDSKRARRSLASITQPDELTLKKAQSVRSSRASRSVRDFLATGSLSLEIWSEAVP
jgi:hypothetical protein